MQLTPQYKFYISALNYYKNKLYVFGISFARLFLLKFYSANAKEMKNDDY
jgi:hypothetical protein